MPDILVVGSYNRDIVVSVPRFPRPGETLPGTGMAFFDGGKGSNQAVQAARCGASVALLARIGVDAAGDQAMGLWTAEGIQTNQVQRDGEHPTGTALILVDAAGENQIILVAGANGALVPDADLRGARVVLAQLETPVEATIAAFRTARAVGATTVLNAAPAAPALSSTLLDLTDLLVVNETEAAALTPGHDGDMPSRALILAARHRLGAVVTAGSDGAYWALAGNAMVAAPAIPVQVVDSTGAGDAFCGTLAAALAEGLAREDALRRAVAAGGLACMRQGAVASLASRDSIVAAMS